MNVIELERWKPSEEDPRKLEYAGQPMAQEVFEELKCRLESMGYFKEDLRVTIQALGWRSEGRYLPLQDDISSVAYWYSDTLEDVYPPLPDNDGLEIV